MDSVDEHGAETRFRLLESAMEVFAEKGFEKATVREICQRAGAANLNAVSYYFRNKEGLYEHILKLIFTELKKQRELEENTERKLSPEDQFRNYLFKYCTILFSSDFKGREAMTIFMAETSAPAPHLKDTVTAYIKDQTREFEELVRALMGPNVPTEVLRDCMVSIIGQMLYYVNFWSPFSTAFPDHPGMAEYHKKLADHVYRFSMGGLKAIRQALETGELS